MNDCPQISNSLAKRGRKYILFIYFISFAQKNTEEKKNTEDMQTLVIITSQYTNNNLNIWTGTPQQLSQLLRTQKIKGY